MNENANGVEPAADDEELSTTAPNPQPTEWKMPEPVFRKTSGRLPRGFEKGLEEARAEHAASQGKEEFTPIDSVSPDHSYSDPTAKNSTVKLVLVLLALAGMIAFIAIFLTVLYFFFWKS